MVAQADQRQPVAVEKPDEATAARYVADGGYFWNSGMFLFQASAYLEELQRLVGAEGAAQAVRGLVGALEGAQDHVAEFIRIDRLKKIINTIDFEGFEGVLIVCRSENDRRGNIRTGENIETQSIGQLDIHEKKIRQRGETIDGLNGLFHTLDSGQDLGSRPLRLDELPQPARRRS